MKTKAEGAGIAGGRDVSESMLLSGDGNRATTEADERQQTVSVNMGGISRDEYAMLLTEMAETRKALAEIAQLRNALIGNRDYGLIGAIGRLGEMNKEQEAVRRWLVWLTVTVAITIILQLAMGVYVLFFA